MIWYRPSEKRNIFIKKIALLLVVSALLAPSVFAAPSDEEVEEAFSGVFAAYGAIFLTSIMGQTITGIAMDMNMEVTLKG
ncbi:MAG: hypothetical protein DRP70_03240 [Spirochaetes bacterium]|nr:MAG: hypothetical protein DRP70_03240 [Spirochaetota bacterium]